MRKKRIILLLLLIVIIFTTVGCEKITFKSEIESKFNIVFPEKELREYIKKARKNEDDIDELYKEIVYEPIRSELTRDTGYPDYDFPNIQYTIKDLDKLEKSLEICIEEDIISFTEDILRHCDSFLSSEETTVYIMPLDPNNVHFSMGGVTGFTGLDGEIVVCINTMIDDWKEFFPTALAHEYHHSILMKERNYKGGWNISMLEYLLLEGRADSFADIVYPNVEKTWMSPLPIIKEKDMWDKIKGNLDSIDYKYQREIMLGGCKGIPRLCGYRMGYNIMQEFIKNNPDVTIEEWTSMKAEEILEKSGYEESLEKRLEEYNN